MILVDEKYDGIVSERVFIENGAMFENLIMNLKLQSLKVSGSLSNFKNNTNNGLDQFKNKIKKKLSPNVEHNPIPQSPSTPVQNYRDLRWPVLIDNEMHWVPHVPHIEEDESEDIVERFTHMSNVNRNYKRRNDREEIRRRLAMGSDADDYYGGDRPGRKPSLQARLQSGMNLQICFMNEAMSDNESPNSDSESGSNSAKDDEKCVLKRPDSLAVNKCHFDTTNHKRPSTSLLTLPLKSEFDFKKRPLTEAEFFACQAQLQADARLALSQAKEMARMQMEVERQRLQTSPITEMVRCSLEKVGVSFPRDRRRLSRQILTEMNVAQLQVIVNDLHTQIETLNESLVKFLIDRDDLHMEQDSMLVDIEDLTRYLGGKGKEKPQEVPNVNLVHLNNNINQNRITVSSTTNE